MQRLIAIGDIHGHSDKLSLLLGQVRPTADDQLVFLGDYIDRGPRSKEVIDRLIRLQKQFPQTVFVRGNHDQMFLDVLADAGLHEEPTLKKLSISYARQAPGTNMQLFQMNGGGETLLSYGSIKNIPPEHIEFLQATRLTYRNDPFLFVHAGAKSEFEAEEQDPFVLLWSRFSPAGQNGKVHVVGHTPTEGGQPTFEQGRYMLDTGAAYKGPLTACDVLTRQFWQAGKT